MTCIAAYINNGEAHMAADSRLCRGTEYQDGVSKIIAFGNALIGTSGDNGYDEIVRAAWNASAGSGPEETPAACRAVAAAMLQHRKDLIVGNEEPTLASALIATPYALHMASSDGSVTAFPRGWHAIGSGGAEARSVLWIFSSYGDIRETIASPRQAVGLAVGAAKALDNGCGGDVAYRCIVAG